MSRPSFEKRQREKDRREKAQAKAERRADRHAAAKDRPAPEATEDEALLLADLAALHARFDAGDIEFDDFAKAKREITDRLALG